MIVNIDELDRASIESDICIIGSGIAGITLANEFINSNLHVVIIESGVEKRDGQIQSLNAGEFEQSGCGLKKNCPDALINDRQRSWGGGSNLWGGMVAPMDVADFQERSWISNSGWPFSRKEMVGYYDRASDFLEIPHFDFDVKQKLLINRSGFLFDENWLMPKRFFNANNLRIGENFHSRFKKSLNIDVLLNATVVRLELNNSGSIDYVHVKHTKRLKKINIRAKCYVMAAGGIENARLLLNSNNTNRRGVANDNDIVGRFYQGHGYTPTLRPSIFLLVESSKNLSFFQNKIVNGSNEFNLVGLSLAAQQEKRLLNAYTSLFTDGWTWPIEPDGLTQSLLNDYSVLAKDLKNKSFKWHSVYSTMLFEQEPNFESRILLTDEIDFLGMRRARVEARISEMQIRTVVETYNTLARFIGSNLGGKVIFNKDISTIFDSIEPGMAKHHIGTTRMSQSAKLGVVDSNCKAHFVSNLWIAGSSVFPTSSATNPSFTIIAMTMRLADHLKRKFNG